MRLSCLAGGTPAVRSVITGLALMASAVLAIRATSETSERIPIFAYYVAGYATPSVSGTWIGWFETISRREINHYQRSREGQEFLEEFYGRADLRRSLKWYLREDLASFNETEDIRSLVTSAISPIRIPYDSTNIRVIKEHIAEARENGISGFIINWEGRGTQSDKAAHLILNQAPPDFFIVLLYSFLPATGKAFQDDLFYLNQRFFFHENYYKVNQFPLIVLSASTVASFPPSDWIDILRETYRTTRFNLFGDTANPPGYVDLFNGLILTDLTGFLTDPLSFSKNFKENLVAFRSVGQEVCLPVYPGYLHYRAGRTLSPSVPRDAKRFARDLATALAVQPDCVIVFSYNDWRSGTAVEPSLEDGDRFLKAIRDTVFPRPPAGIPNP
ncbi:MAG: hypothetical protein V2G42_01660 [bacterium JZ-2024 1]